MPDSALPASIAAAGARLRAGDLTAVALTEHCLARIRSEQPRLNAFITVTAEQARATARERDAELGAGRDRGPLHGIPIVHKDCFDTAGVATTVGADLFRERVPRRDADIVRRLADAGAVMLGKTHMNELAAGMSGRNSFFGDARNPRDTARAAGGSSSGSACAIAARLCLGATGTDAGGSVRLPAAWTGIVGLRPTYGRVSTGGAYPRAHSLDCAGPLAGSVADAATLFDVLAGTTGSAAAPGDLRGVRLALVRDFSLQEIDEDVGRAVQGALERFARIGAELQELSIPAVDYRVVFDILLYEFYQVAGGEERRRFGPVVQANLERGASISAEQYRSALDERARFGAALCKTLQEVDALITPTAPMTALPLDAPEVEFDRTRRFTIPFSLAGVPALSIPCGSDRAGLPVGLQLVGSPLAEPLLLRIAAAYEAASQ